MIEVERELSRLDAMRAPQLEARIRERMTAPGDPAVVEGRSPGSRIVAAMVALLVFAGAALVTWTAFSPGEAGRIGESPSPAPTMEQEPWAAFGPGWTPLPEPPEVRVGAAAAWTGQELILWGGVPEGEDAPALDGFAFDPLGGTWRPIPAAPVGTEMLGTSPRPVWTGTELLFYPVGLAFDPSAGAWRRLPPAPHDPRQRQTAVAWTGSEMVVFGGGDREAETARQGAAYDPVADRWRTIAEAPIGLNLLSAAWTGREVIVFGSLLNDRNLAETDTSVGAAYDPVSDTWRMLPPSGLSPQATSAVWLHDRLIAWDYEVRSQQYDPAVDAWSAPVGMPMEFSECYPDSVVTSDVVFAWFCGQAAVLDASEGSWERIRGGVLEPTLDANEQEYALFRFAAFVGAGEVVAIASEGITLDADGVPCYGCPGAPVSYWVYRPELRPPSTSTP